MAAELLDPKNDYVFKRVFGEDPALVVALINDLRPDLPEIQSVEILNPGVNAEELRGKYIVLDVLARDAVGHAYDIEIQVRRYGAWHQRALYYLARMLASQLDAGEDYAQLRAAVGIHLLDFDLFTETPAQCAQALWRFEMRDARQPAVSLGNRLQLTLIELKKADRLRQGTGPLGDWVSFFEHWREEKTMSEIEHGPIREALNRVRQLSADDEARRMAFVRERALRDEVSLLKEAREQGRQEAAQETARNLIRLGTISDTQIAQATGLTVEQVEALRQSPPR
ncbi:Rpn family recombination-promoting nuclease/putative transposase [Thiorhodococcus minor]|uniref:Rpn family recombination-promoting nuclease/putative transposase n=1 Tax=Thiorhodococcus minor TaxID=57489 RepID=A0A6M0K9C6_9GAMM|nr:Rpn family recombination-promoting nuclease/putative transposase [Thiorhodococcus minor]NEV65307.1 Rpn family recombination-promoting nuclease/putative transposase [Thiorhodococcus minor]